MTLPAAASEALRQFGECSGWEQRARLLLRWGASLEPLNEAQCCEANRVTGCESNVWLIAGRHADVWIFRANSDARLLSGLLALLLVRVNGLSTVQLNSLDLNGWFDQLGLGRQLSPSRSNGLNAVLQRMRELAAG